MRRILAALLAVLMILQSTVALAGTPTTWGRLKRLYAEEAPTLTFGPGITAEEATRILNTVRTEGRTDPGRVHVYRMAVDGRPGPYVVLGRLEAGVGSVHLVSPAGRVLGGTVLDLNRGVAEDALDHAVVWRAATADPLRELEALLPEGHGVGEAVESGCKILAFSIYRKCAAAAGASPLGQIGCAALLLVMFLACQGDLHFRRADDADCRDASRSSGLSGSSLGSFCD